jgi:parvulin-like peptidyl-prolyl isomerase
MKVNGEEITEEALEREFRSVKAAYRDPSLCCEQDDEFRRMAEDNLVSAVLLSHAATAGGIFVTDTEIDDAFSELKSQYQNEDDFYEANDLTPDDDDMVRNDLARNIRVRRHIEKLCGEPDTSPQAVTAHYQKNIDRFMSQRQARILHIVKQLDHGQDRDAALEAMAELRSQLRSGANFAELAAEHSDSQESIDIEFFERGQLIEELETAAFSMDIDEISPVIASGYGYHLIKLQEIKEPEAIPLDEIQDEVGEDWVLTYRNEAVQAEVDRLKESASIERDEE